MPGTIVSTRELARTFENELRVGGVAKRRWVCNLSDDTLAAGGPPGISDILNATCGGTWGVAHPIHTAFGLRKITVNERFEEDPYKLEVVGEYGIVNAEDALTPTARAAVWSFESQAGEVPALFYYHPGGAGSGNGTTRPLTNSAFDYFPGLTTDESMVRVKIQKNFATLAAGPLAWLAVQNFVNSSTYLGCAPHTIKVAAVEVQYSIEEFQGTKIAYWAATASLLYRQSSHNLLLPDVGFNFIFDGQKRRAMVFDFQNAEWVASSNPVGLDGTGGQTLGAPEILTRRVNPEANLFSVFGAPPA